MIDFKSDIILENHLARLVPLDMAHKDGLFVAGAGDDTLLQYSFNRVHTRELVEEYVQKFLEGRKLANRYAFTIFDVPSGEIAGVTTFLNVSNLHARVEIGSTWIGRAYQRTGLNRNCKFLLLSYCFETANMERVELKTDFRNEQSKTAIQKIGGTFEGELRNHSVMPDGFRRNTCVYSILKSEWPAIKSTVFKEYV